MKKIVLIFGSGSGIGFSIFEKLLSKHDEDILLFGFSRRGLQYDKDFVANQNHLFDLKKPEHYLHFQTAFAKLIQKYKLSDSTEIQLIVYFAQGDGIFKRIEEIELEELQSHFHLNLFSSLELLKILAPTIRQLPGSLIIFLSSTASRIGFENATAYCASKHAVSGLAKALREEWKPFGIKVVNAFLGAIATSIWDDRKEFSKNDMISVSDAGEFLASISYLPQTLYLDEFYVTPRKGVL